MDTINVTPKKYKGRGYSGTKAWDDGKVYISIGRGVRLDDAGDVICIHDDVLDIELRDEEARRLIDEWKEAKASNNARQMQSWVSSCVTAMYKHAMKEPTIIKRVYDAAYNKGYREGDRARLELIHAALRV